MDYYSKIVIPYILNAHKSNKVYLQIICYVVIKILSSFYFYIIFKKNYNSINLIKIF